MDLWTKRERRFRTRRMTESLRQEWERALAFVRMPGRKVYCDPFGNRWTEGDLQSALTRLEAHEGRLA